MPSQYLQLGGIAGISHNMGGSRTLGMGCEAQLGSGVQDSVVEPAINRTATSLVPCDRQGTASGKAC